MRDKLDTWLANGVDAQTNADGIPIIGIVPTSVVGLWNAMRSGNLFEIEWKHYFGDGPDRKPRQVDVYQTSCDTDAILDHTLSDRNAMKLAQHVDYLGEGGFEDVAEECARDKVIIAYESYLRRHGVFSREMEVSSFNLYDCIPDDSNVSKKDLVSGLGKLLVGAGNSRNPSSVLEDMQVHKGVAIAVTSQIADDMTVDTSLQDDLHTRIYGRHHEAQIPLSVVHGIAVETELERDNLYALITSR